MNTLVKSCLYLLLAFVSQTATASGAAYSKHLAARLIGPAEVTASGGDILLGIQETPAKGWHTYWINPGETGLATEISWTLPKGVTAGAAQWPTPEKFTYTGVTTYGYGHESTLLVHLRNGAGLKVGEILPVKAHLDVLVCEKICVPESLDLSLDLKVAAQPATPFITNLKSALNALPRPLKTQATIRWQDGFIEMGFVNDEALQNFIHPEGVYAFPVTEGIVNPSAPQLLNKGNKGFSLRILAPEKSQPQTMPVVLKFADGLAWAINLVPGPLPEGTFTPATISRTGLWLAITLAFAGGLILNLMPCVFPILSLKLLALTRAGHDKKLARLEALLYCAGSIVSFLALAAALDLARDFGASLGWGFPLQSPFVTGFLSLLLLVAGLNMSGFFEVGSSLQSFGGRQLTALQDKPRLSAFMTGVLAVVIAAPCSAPFMATAIGAALAQGGLASFAIFTNLGIGFAAPFVALTFAITLIPSVARLMPKPGIWMIRLRNWLALPMYAAAIWMLWVFAQQVTAPKDYHETSVHTDYETFSPKAIAALRAANKPILVDLTTAWCLTCKVNERMVLSHPDVLLALRDSGTILMIGDWTNRDANILDYLRQFGRSGVPLYVYYGPHHASPVILPQILNKNDLINLLSFVG